MTLRAETGSNFGALQQREGGIYDKYLILRTFIPLFLLRYVLTDRPTDRPADRSIDPNAIIIATQAQETN